MQAMSKPMKGLDLAVRVVFLVLLALFVFGGLAGILLLFFVPIVGWFVWRLLDRTSELEKRLAALEKPAEKKPEDS